MGVAGTPGPNPSPAAGPPEPRLLYDGECGLCQACVRLLRRIDREGRLSFLPLQDPAARAWLRARGLSDRDFDTAVLVEDWRLGAASSHRLRTDGILGAAAAAGGVGREVANLRAVPRAWRDLIYRLVARCRHWLWGRPPAGR